MGEKLTLRFTGRISPGLEGDEIAAAISGFTNLAQLAGASVFGDEPTVKLYVTSVRPGSQNIDLWIEVAGVTQTIVSAAGLTEVGGILEYLKSWFSLLKHLGGKPPTSVRNVGNGDMVEISNNSGGQQVYAKNVYFIFNQHDVGRDAENVVKPLKGKATGLEIRAGRRAIARVSKKDAAAFRSVKKTDESLETTAVVLLKVVAPVLEGSGVWRFTRGRNRITASLADPNFIEKVHSGRESFRAGDILKVKLRSYQHRIGDIIKDSHVIEKVLSHERPADSRERKIS